MFKNIKKDIFPLRCFSCGKVIYLDYKEFYKFKQENNLKHYVDDVLKLQRYCCRRMVVCYDDLK